MIWPSPKSPVLGLLGPSAVTSSCSCFPWGLGCPQRQELWPRARVGCSLLQAPADWSSPWPEAASLSPLPAGGKAVGFHRPRLALLASLRGVLPQGVWSPEAQVGTLTGDTCCPEAGVQAPHLGWGFNLAGLPLLICRLGRESPCLPRVKAECRVTSSARCTAHALWVVAPRNAHCSHQHGDCYSPFRG